MNRELNLSDLHIPYYDVHAWNLVLNIAEEVQPDAINILGDALDFYKLSRFNKDPGQLEANNLQANLDEWFGLMEQLQRTVYRCTFRYLPGNHEGRLNTYLQVNSELYGLDALKLENLLRLEELGIEYYEDEIEIIPGVLQGVHGDKARKFSGYSAKAHLEDATFSYSIIHGHTHRLGAYYHRTRKGQVVAFENGCLCRLDPEYAKYPNWQLGCTIVDHYADQTFNITPVPFLGEGERLKAVVDGKAITL